MVTDEYITFAQAKISHRSNKCLGFKKPAVLFKEMVLPD
ncbi:hypothetical protein BTN49_1721 [Candidatus Enterovibrio escicola]|uniref:Mobile element protein n=1 Tax=Candidatus Enterovibrio escicola TaxID=1927127 RepID=A0A2A5T3M2_9GAMM|nr:hypothetical protein BTN49_1721 [Candidatus Enterovibrio escacola]